MTARRGALAAGLAAAAAYLILAAASGAISPLARRPLLDGFAPPPPYRWASPPPDLASANQPPDGGSFTLTFTARGGTQATALTTNDVQASLVLPEGSFPRMEGKRSLRVTIRPLPPSAAGPAPDGLSVAGNVYRIQADYQPGGPSVSALAKPSRLTLFYPAAPDNLVHQHSVLHSTDGRTWTKLETFDSPAQQQATASIPSLGYVAVGSSGTGTAKPFPWGRVVYYVLLGGFAVFLVVTFVVSEIRRRKPRAGRPVKREPPPRPASRKKRRR